jgi:hypothetical protein
MEQSRNQSTTKGGLLWRIPEDESSGFFGGLQANKQIISFNLTYWTVGFVLWYRRFIPNQHQLFFFNSSSWDSLEITPNIAKKEIEDFISSKSHQDQEQEDEE